MFWWLFWASVMRRYNSVEAATVRSTPAGRVAHGERHYGVTRRSRQGVYRKPPARGSLLRLVCVDGVRVDRAAS